MANLAAVLTGDIVGSTKVPPDTLEKGVQVLETAAAKISSWQSGATDTKFTRFRGDGWQILLGDHELALRAAIFMIAELRAAKLMLLTRVAIGTGSVEKMGTSTLADAHGKAFEHSGHALDRMNRTNLLAISGTTLSPLHTAVVALIEARIWRWTPQQAEALAIALHPERPTLKKISGQLGISKQAVNYRLNGAGSNSIRLALEIWEEEQLESKIRNPKPQKVEKADD